MCIRDSATTIWMVEQFGFAITPLCQATSPGFTSGTTNGTSSSMRNALELSIITAPAAATASRISFDTVSYTHLDVYKRQGFPPPVRV